MAPTAPKPRTGGPPTIAAGAIQIVAMRLFVFILKIGIFNVLLKIYFGINFLINR